jgi:proteasome lid subunit RPN8/RPN11
MGRPRKPPLLSVRPAALRAAVDHAAAVAERVPTAEAEVYGYLVGRRTVRGAQVHCTAAEPNATADDHALYLDEEDRERRMHALCRRHAPLEIVGDYHSHVYDEFCTPAFLSQLSEDDDSGTGEGQFEIVLAVLPAEIPPGFRRLFVELRRRSPDLWAFRRHRSRLVRAEAYLKRRGWCEPAALRVR